MPQVPANQLNGTFAYNLMRGQNLGNQNYIPIAKNDVVGLAGKKAFKSNEWPEGARWGALPVMTAFYPSQYPPPPAPTDLDANPFPPVGPSYSPNIGYYPFTESGVMVIQNGKVRGVIRINFTGMKQIGPALLRWY